jgi:serine/threonine-protein kinase
MRPDLPEEIDEVIARGMAKDPAERYASASELAQAAALALGFASQLTRPGTRERARSERPAPAALTTVSEDP